MKKILLIAFIAIVQNTFGQYTKEKLHDVLSGTTQKSWLVSGINIERPEKAMTFKADYTGEVESKSGTKQQVKWSLQSADNIRWFITIGTMKYELIVSYNKKGEQYVKLTHHEPGGEFELKLSHSQEK